QETEERDTEEKPNTQETETNTFSVRGGIRYTTEGAGYEEGFTSFEGFIPLFQNPGKNLTFIEGRLLLQNNAALGGNVVLGQRFFDESANRVYGGYIAYDNRDTGNNSFNQIGVGFETLGENWDFRINGYFPIGDNRQLADESFPSVFGFQGNDLLLNRTRQFESAMTEVDTEFGGKIARLGEGSLRGYAGLYYIDAPGDDSALGVKGRLEIRPTDYLTLNLSVQNDRIFDTRVVASLGITFPGTSARGNNDDKPKGLDRMGDTVARQSTILVLEQTEQDRVAAINPETNQPWRFQHVVLGANGGNGTFESPVGTVQNGIDGTVSDGNNIVYVQLGNNSEILPFEIPDQVQVLSTGPVQELDTKQAGTVILPLSGTGQLPSIDPLVIMRNNSTLAGFAIINAPDSAVFGRNVRNVTIRNNLIVNPAQEAIKLENVTGGINIANNIIDRTRSDSGILIDNSFGAADLRIANNTITNAVEDGITLNLRGTAQGTANISNNVISRNGIDGISLQIFDTAQGTVNITGNSIFANRAIGIETIGSNRSQQTLNIANNIISQNGPPGSLWVGIRSELNGTAIGTINITNNAITDNAYDGIGIVLDDTATGTVNINNNDIYRNGRMGIFTSFEDVSQGTLNVTNNRVSNNRDHGIYVSPRGNSTSTITINNNTANNNGINGIFLESFNFSTSTATISNNIASGNGLDGISTRTNNNSFLRSLVQGNTTNNNGRFGIEMTTFNTSRLFTGVRFNTLIANPGSFFPFFPFGFGAQTLETSTLCLDLRNNSSSNGFVFNPVSGTFNGNASGNNGTVVQSNSVNSLGFCPAP
ncbi:MAG TPA: hypothetical protein DEA78_10260, partial [Cyanobacteria bacterium UBA11159]|nr:hypothetical protein [Cyanobacteria bacterium UBA11159]